MLRVKYSVNVVEDSFVLPAVQANVLAPTPYRSQMLKFECINGFFLSRLVVFYVYFFIDSIWVDIKCHFFRAKVQKQIVELN